MEYATIHPFNRYRALWIICIYLSEEPERTLVRLDNAVPDDLPAQGIFVDAQLCGGFHLFPLIALQGFHNRLFFTFLERRPRENVN